MKVNVIIDLNLLFHRWVHYLSAKNPNFLSDGKDKLKLVKGVHSSLNADVNRYKHYVDRVILTVDSKFDSWRKFAVIKEKQSFYKEKREKDYDFDYKVFLDTMNAYCKIMSEKGIYVIDVDNAEGDDLCYAISNVLYQQGHSSIIITSDSDIRQLIKSDKSKFVFIFDSFMDKKIHYVDRYIELGENTVISTSETVSDEFNGIFDEPAAKETFNADQILNDIYDQSKIVDPNLVKFCKMLAGDKGDNVPSVYYKPRKNDSISFTNLRAEAVYFKISEKTKIDSQYFLNMYTDEKMRRELASKVLEEAKSLEINKIGDIADNIKRNILFTLLDDSVYEAKFKERLYTKINEVLSDEEFLINHKNVISEGYNFSLLTGTELETSSDTTVYYEEKR